MRVRPKPLRALDADRAIAERGAFGRAGNDTNVADVLLPGRHGSGGTSESAGTAVLAVFIIIDSNE